MGDPSELRFGPALRFTHKGLTLNTLPCYADQVANTCPPRECKRPGVSDPAAAGSDLKTGVPLDNPSGPMYAYVVVDNTTPPLGLRP